jgi:ectoine hydroxylase-related dioxygenase (phytanoyl-CoA dioxygenase family)
MTDLDSPYALSEQQIESFRSLGWVALPRLLAAEDVTHYAGPLRAAVHDVYSKLTPEQRGMYLADPLWTRDAAAKRFMWAPRFAQLAASLLGASAVRLARDVAFFKQPGTDATPWHQDSEFEPIDGNDVVVLWIALNDIEPDMSPMCFLEGSQRLGYRRLVRGRSDPTQPFDAPMRDIGGQIGSFSGMRAGDATAHYGWTFHGAPRHTGTTPREAIAVLYYRDGVRLSVPDLGAAAGEELLRKRKIHQHHMSQRFAGLSIGDLAQSEMCPVVYRDQSAQHDRAGAK